MSVVGGVALIGGVAVMGVAVVVKEGGTIPHLISTLLGGIPMQQRKISE